MYDYHYNVMQKHYGENIELMYTDTGKLSSLLLLLLLSFLILFVLF